MSGEKDHPFNGVLKVKGTEDDRYEFRLYPWTFSNDPFAEEVCEIVFKAQDLDLRVVSRFEGREVNIEFTGKTISIYDWDFGDEYEFSAEAISQRMICYELSDFVNQIAGLEAALKIEYRKNVVARQKLDKHATLVDELLRRAEFKAASSTEQEKLQQPTIRALKRIKLALEKNDGCS